MKKFVLNTLLVFLWPLLVVFPFLAETYLWPLMLLQRELHKFNEVSQKPVGIEITLVLMFFAIFAIILFIHSKKYSINQQEEIEYKKEQRQIRIEERNKVYQNQ